MKKVTIKGKRYTIKKSPRKNKQLMVEELNIHFGDPNMPEFPGTKRGDNYCARSYGIKGKGNIKSPNFWSRTYLWNCKGKKSLEKKLI